MQITFPVPISTFSSCIPPKRSGYRKGLQNRKILDGSLTGRRGFLGLDGVTVPF